MSRWNDLVDSVFNLVGLAGFTSRASVFFIGLCCSIPTIVFYYFLFSLRPLNKLVLWDRGLHTDRVYITHSHAAFHCRPLLIIIIIIIYNTETANEFIFVFRNVISSKAFNFIIISYLRDMFFNRLCIDGI